MIRNRAYLVKCLPLWSSDERKLNDRKLFFLTWQAGLGKVGLSAGISLQICYHSALVVLTFRWSACNQNALINVRILKVLYFLCCLSLWSFLGRRCTQFCRQWNGWKWHALLKCTHLNVSAVYTKVKKKLISIPSWRLGWCVCFHASASGCV